MPDSTTDPGSSFADRIRYDERDQADTRAATAEQERDQALDDLRETKAALRVATAARDRNRQQLNRANLARQQLADVLAELLNRVRECAYAYDQIDGGTEQVKVYAADVAAKIRAALDGPTTADLSSPRRIAAASSVPSRRAQGQDALFDRAALIARWEENFGFDLERVDARLAGQEADHVADLIAAAVEATRRAQDRWPSAEETARLLHNTHEKLLYPDARLPWSEVPEQNRALMVAVCAKLLDWLARGAPGGRPAQTSAPEPAPTTVSSIIAVSNRFARAATGEEAGTDWVRLRTGSGRQYEGYRSPSCPGDGVTGHRHDIRCVSREMATGGVVEKPVDLNFGLPANPVLRWPS